MTRSNQSRMIVLVSVLLCGLHFADAQADVLAVPEVEQEENQWCWAGVTQSILRYYGTAVTQCEIAEHARSSRPEYFGTVNCCVDRTQGCNQPNHMGESGGITDILRHFGGIESQFVSGVLSSDDCATEIASYRPFNIRWGWSSGGGHFVVGHGIELSDVGGDHTFYYMDPWYGEGLSVATYAWVVEGSNHTWTSTNRIDTVPDCICFSVETCCDGCRPFEDGLVCDDGDPLTTGDVCTAGICEGTAGPGCDVDSDGDGVMDCVDVCPGFDDTLDCNGNGVPDGCDLVVGPFEYEHKLTASDGAAYDELGMNVEIDGDAFVVAAPYDDDRGTDSGSVYVYRHDGSSTWNMEQKLTASDGEAGDSFGRYLSIHGDTIAVGAWGDDDRGDNAGAVYVYRYDGSGTWNEEQKLTASDGDAGDEFGEDVSIHGDTIAIGAWADEDRGVESGSVYVYRYDPTRPEGERWVEEQKLHASDGAAFDLFGYRVSTHGDTIVVGALQDDDQGTDSGSAYVYRYDPTRPEGARWFEEQKLTAPDGDAWDIFGLGVSIHGNTIVVGAPYDDDPVLGTDAGSAYVYRYDPTRSAGERWVEQTKLTASDGDIGDHFGEGVSTDGDTIVVGAAYDNDPVLGTDAGSAYVYRYDGVSGPWVEDQKLTAPDGAVGDVLGYGVAVDGGTIVAGAYGRDDRGTDSGAVYTFERPGTSADCDLDGVPDECQPDTDLDGLIDACDDDDDGDGTPDPDDGCPLDADKIDPGACGCGQPDTDSDGDGVADCVDQCPGQPDTDSDGDGVLDCYDQCPGQPDTDSDGDGVANCVDQCPGAPDTDADGDGIADCVDECPAGTGDPVVFVLDSCPDDPNKNDPGQCGCGVPDTDSDGDGVADCVDQCPGAPDNPLVFTMDWCPDDPNKLDPGACGCGVPDADSDGDGVADCVDQCPGEPDTDSDGDGVADCVDQCPGEPDTDSDGDSVPDCLDLCPNDAAKTEPGLCGCGMADVDSDGDGVLDCDDACRGFDDTLDCNGNGVPDGCDIGDLYENERKLTASDGAADDFFGEAVSIHGDTIVVGAYSDDEMGDASGSAYVYRYDAVAGDWVEAQKLTASDGAPGDLFGISISIHNDTFVVGAYGDDDPVLGDVAGSVYVYRYNPTRPEGDRWFEQQKLTASDGAAGDFFGKSVSTDSDTIVVGAHYDDEMGDASGSAYVYRYDAGSGQWFEQQKLTASDGAASDYFGNSVSIHGDTIVVGARSESAYVYRYDADSEVWVEEQKLTASDGAAGDYFGNSVSTDSDTIVVGAYADDGAEWNSGSAYVYRYDAVTGTWVEEQKLTASDNGYRDHFGSDVSIHGDTIAVGAYGDDDLGSFSGSAYVYRYNPTRPEGDRWFEQQKLTASDGAASDNFGNSVSIHGDTIVVGADYDEDLGDNSGSAYTYERASSSSDCNSDGVPDDCQPDTDLDGLIDACDCDPANAYCSTDCTDGDVDGHCVTSDCNDASAGSWGTPGEVAGLRFGAGTKDDLSWDAPAEPGGDAPRYDTVRSDFADDFGAATCIESGDGSDRTATDVAVPDPGMVFHYLVRAENDCPAGQGNLGHDSQGVERSAPICP